MSISLSSDPAAPNVVVPRLPPSAAAAQKAGFKIGAMLWGMAGVLVLGGLGGFLVGKYGRNLIAPFLGPKNLIPLTLCLLPIQWIIVVGWHELGHVVGGWMGGGKFLLYAVGPFMWRRTPAGIRFSWNKNINLMGGLASCLPLDPALASPRRLAVMIAGGPVFSLVLATAALWVGALLGEAHQAGKSWAFAQQFALFTAFLSLAIFTVTAFPGTTGGFKTDGRRFFDLLRGDARSHQEKALIALTASSLAGVRPADYDPDLVTQSLALRDGSLFDLYAHLTAYSHAADLGEFARAQALLDYLLADEAKLMPYARDAARCEYAWLLATQTSDAGAARAWLDSAGPLSLDLATRLRAEAAVLLREGSSAEAATRAQAGLRALTQGLSPSVNAFHAEALQEILRQAVDPNAQRPTSNFERSSLRR